MGELSVIEQSFIIAMLVVLYYAAIQEGELFFFVKKYTWRWPWWVNRIIHECLKCTTVWVGLIVISLAGGDYVSAFVAAGINAVVDKILDYG